MADGVPLENVWCEPQRGLDKSVMRDLATCQWIRKKDNVIVVGKTGVGKSYLGAALAQADCRKGLRALCTRVPRLVHKLAIARADGTYTTMLARLAKLGVLVLDDFLVAPRTWTLATRTPGDEPRRIQTRRSPVASFGVHDATGTKRGPVAVVARL